MNRISILLLGVAGCFSAVPARFHDRPIVTRSDDERPIPEPSKRPFFNLAYATDATVFRPMVAGLDRASHHHAGDVNALDEVPDSTWFENRIGIREVAPEEAARGATTDGPPQPPFVVKSVKTEGNPGFILEDSRGTKYLVKFDTLDNPEQQTASNVIVNRIFWTLGYHVPADYVFALARDQLTYDGEPAVIDRIVDSGTAISPGTVRATASQLLAGSPKGGWPAVGTRDDDPNDRVPHEDRRTVRGLRVISAWLGHTDMKEANSLDMYVGEPGQGHLVHYLVDFGEALGGHQSEKQRLEVGWEYGWDWSAQAKGLVSFGLWKRPWEGQEPTPWLSVGYFAADKFDPDRWHSLYRYEPFERTDATDDYWATKLIMRFDEKLLTRIVDEARLSDRAAARYLVTTLLARRATIGATYLDRVTPFDELAIAADGKLCGVDLARKYGVRADGDLIVDGQAIAIAEDGRACAALPAGTGYRVLRLQIRTATLTTPAMEVHIAGATPHIVGIVR